MKVAAVAFYTEVTGKHCSVNTSVEALKRWEIPFDADAIGNRKRGVDIVHLPDAKAKHAEEMNHRAERKLKEATRVPRAVGNCEVAEKLDRMIVLLDAIYEVLAKK